MKNKSTKRLYSQAIDHSNDSNKRIKVSTHKPLKKQKVIQVSTDTDHMLVLVQSGHVYSLGNNDYGQLGQGDLQMRDDPCLIDPAWFNHEKVIQVCASFRHSTALTRSGSVYVWGIQDYDIGDNEQQTCSIRPKRIDSSHFHSDPVSKIEVSIDNSFFAITRTNMVFSWGCAKNGRLSSGDEVYRPLPKVVDPLTYNNEIVKKISCGYSTTMLLTQGGNVYASGFCTVYRDGFNNSTDVTLFCQIPRECFFHENVVDIQGLDNCFAITESGLVYKWGSESVPIVNMITQGDQNTQVLKAEHVFTSEKMSTMYEGSYHSLFVARTGKVFCQGDNERGQLGLGHCDSVDTPSMVSSSHFDEEKVVSAGANRDALGGYSYAVTRNGRLFVWGSFGRRYSCFPEEHWGDLFGSVPLDNKKYYNGNAFKDVTFEFQ